jgi:ADP-ribosyl-[dinitrogen reductase] hydrolase
MLAAAANAAQAAPPHAGMDEVVKDRIAGSLWGLFIADALASPTHWFYGGDSQVKRAYAGGIRGYVKPNETCEGSIMNKSNTGGAGRGSNQGDIIGTVINHGKKKYWAPGKSIHYHCTLDAGENTLEAQLVRVLIRGMAKNGGVFDADQFREDYMKFMQTPGSHNDCYASTCHRMFFENLVSHGKPPDRCPSNDQHNVDAIDGLVLPTAVALATVTEPMAEAEAAVARCVGVTRRSPALEAYSAVWAGLLRSIVAGEPLKKATFNACSRHPALASAAREISIGTFDAVVS